MDYAQIVRDATDRKQVLLAEMEKLDALIASAGALAGSLTPVTKTLRLRRKSSTVTPTREAATAILRAHGEPIPTKNLLALIRERGVEVGGKDAVATLSARLSNASEFTIHRGIGWWFTGEPLPGALSVFDETTEPTSTEDSAVSNVSTGGSEDATALALKT